jgi:ABC-2 type transport system ATP-binding protein
MPVDRPRRALVEEPDDVESYVARRSLGFTPADHHGDSIARPTPAARALEPAATTQPSTASDHREPSDPPRRPRRALPPEPLTQDAAEENSVAIEWGIGRRALEPQPSAFAPMPQNPAPVRPPTAPGASSTAPVSPPPRPTPRPSTTATPASLPPLPTPPPRKTTVAPVSPSITTAAPKPAPVAQPLPAPPPAPQRTPPPPMQAEYAHPSPPEARSRPRPASRAARPIDRQALRPAEPATGRRGALASVRQTRAPRRTVDQEVPPIVIDRLIKSYNGTLAVHNLSFVVEPGRVTGFLGPNGAGKTTTMRILVGLATPTTGTATFGRLEYAELPHPQQKVGCVLDASFHPGRSGRNHLRVLAPTAGASDRRIDALLDDVGLSDVARQPVGEYSMGMRQRLALAAAMLGRPDYLILDEPANGLDPAGIRWLRSFLRDFAASGRVVFISSHLLNEIEATADDIVVINRGRLLAQVPMSQLSLGEGTTRARVSDMRAALQALATINADVQTASDERGAYLRIHSHDVGQVGAILFGSGIVVDELTTERRDLEQEFFSMLEHSR